MGKFLKLTHYVHKRVGEVLKAGDRAFDGTAGNGHDTLFLAQQVTPEGHVYAFDIQTEALKTTFARLVDHGYSEHVTLVHDSHAHLERHIPRDWEGHLGAAMFNLGYLPKGDERITTEAKSTKQAIQGVYDLLREGGVLSVLAYRGHPGGQEEAFRTQEVMEDLFGEELEVKAAPHLGPVSLLGVK